MLSREDADFAVYRLRAFAQPERLMILTALLEGELSVSAISAKTGIGQPKLSQQLAELRRMRAVAHRRAAKSVVYRLPDIRVETIVRFIAVAFATLQPLDAVMKPDAADGVPRRISSAAMFAVVEQD